MTMDLRSQDVVVSLKLLTSRNPHWTFSSLGSDLSMSASQVFRSIERASAGHLLSHLRPPPVSADVKGPSRLPFFASPNRSNLKEFLVHGVKYAFPAIRGGLTRGVPTADAAPPLNKHLTQNALAPPVWPYAEGMVIGAEFSPLYKNVPKIALRDPQLYELLALVDAIREGRAREREIAIAELTTRIDSL
jgi:hypothetical protein